VTQLSQLTVLHAKTICDLPHSIKFNADASKWELGTCFKQKQRDINQSI